VIGRGSAILPGFQIMAIMAIPAIMAISLGFPITAMTRGPVPACRGSRTTCPGLPWITGDPSRRAADPERFFPSFQIMAIMAIPAIMAISRGFRWRR
jgi:ABC-type phosphate transport system permease subunit